MTRSLIAAVLMALGLAACGTGGEFQSGESAGTPITTRDAERIAARTAGPSAPTLSRLNPDYRQWANDRR